MIFPTGSDGEEEGEVGEADAAAIDGDLSRSDINGGGPDVNALARLHEWMWWIYERQLIKHTNKLKKKKKQISKERMI